MSSSIPIRFFDAFVPRILRTTKEKWIDGTATLAIVIYDLFVDKPVTFWEGAEPFVWLLCSICAVHTAMAMREVWGEIGRQPLVREVESPILLPNAGKRTTLIREPRPPYFRSQLSGILVLSIVLLTLVAYSVRRAAAASLRTYIYLAPTPDLVECQKRAFFIKTKGPRILYNVEITVKDNKSGQSLTQAYPEIDPGPRSSDVYFWFIPSSPWDEDYTVKVATRESRSSERLILRSAQQQTQFAMDIAVGDEKKPSASCRDPLVPTPYTVAAGERRPCAELMKLPDNALGNLDAYSYQRADGSLQILKLRKLAAPSELDAQSDDRHITEYQRLTIEPILRKYSRSRMLIYFSGGPKSKAYAEEFHKMFSAEAWAVRGPTLVPVGDERIIDIQISVNYEENWNEYEDMPHEILDAFGRAGIKQRRRLILDPNVPRDWIFLWIGPRSPNDVRPDQCSPASTKPAEGEPHTCEMVSQTDESMCPFPPK